MKSKILTMFFALIAVTLSAQMPRSEWHAKVGECALDPVVLKATISKLSSADKTAFLAEVNAAISKMPGSPEAKAAQFLAINRAAVAGAGSADRMAVLAEVFATVPPESLAIINEEFAKNEFARPDTMSSEQYKRIISGAMEKIVQRCASAESGAVRSGFAGLMFIRAAGDAAESVQAAVIAAMPSESQLEARNTWFPAALGKDQSAASYDSMLGTAQADEEADHPLTVSIYSQQIVESMLSDLQTTHKAGEEIGKIERGTTPVDFFNSQTDAMGVKDPLPTRGAAADRVINQALITGRPEDSGNQIENPWYAGDGTTEPGPYWLQHP
jgi:hypothetical protein